MTMRINNFFTFAGFALSFIFGLTPISITYFIFTSIIGPNFDFISDSALGSDIVPALGIIKENFFYNK